MGVRPFKSKKKKKKELQSHETCALSKALTSSLVPNGKLKGCTVCRYYEVRDQKKQRSPDNSTTLAVYYKETNGEGPELKEASKVAGEN